MKLKYEMEIVDIDGSPVAIPVNANEEFSGVLRMNDTTKDIIDVLKNDISEEEIVTILKRKYDATEEQIHSSVQKVLGILREYKLIIE